MYGIRGEKGGVFFWQRVSCWKRRALVPGSCDEAMPRPTVNFPTR